MKMIILFRADRARAEAVDLFVDRGCAVDLIKFSIEDLITDAMHPISKIYLKKKKGKVLRKTRHARERLLAEKSTGNTSRFTRRNLAFVRNRARGFRFYG